MLITFGLVALAAALCSAFGGSAYPAPGFMYAIAQVGVAIVFAYIVEAVWMVERVNRGDGDHRSWLGMTCGLAVVGLWASGGPLR